jgi:hypothetical protein
MPAVRRATPRPTPLLTAPSSPADLHAFLSDAFAVRHRSRRMRLGFAFAKESGLDALTAAIPDLPTWDRAQKEWVIGTQFGLTEPSALRRICDMPGSAARLHGLRPGARRDGRGMFTAGNFHAKIIAVGGSNASRISGLMAGSANLSGAALGAVPLNYEAGLSLPDQAITPALVVAFNNWWERAWREAVPITASVIAAYSEAREKILATNPDLARLAKASSRGGAALASTLWIEAGAMSGGARNQVEFSEDLAPFFGPPEFGRREIRVRFQGKISNDRPLSHKMTTLGVNIWRLSLPSRAATGVDYRHQRLLLRRSEDAGGLLFTLAVADPASATAKRWVALTQTRGYLGLTGGGRDYGLF